MGCFHLVFWHPIKQSYDSKLFDMEQSGTIYKNALLRFFFILHYQIFASHLRAATAAPAAPLEVKTDPETRPPQKQRISTPEQKKFAEEKISNKNKKRTFLFLSPFVWFNFQKLAPKKKRGKKIRSDVVWSDRSGKKLTIWSIEASFRFEDARTRILVTKFLTN